MRFRGEFYTNKQYKLAYLRINKSACSSLCYMLALLKDNKAIESVWDHPEYFDEFETLDNYFTFTFVRNPYTRFLSFYKNWVLNPPHTEILDLYRPFGFYEKMPLNECINCFCNIKSIDWSDDHACPQYLFVFDKYKYQRVQFIGKVENIYNDIEKISKKTKVPLLDKIKHLNKTSKEEIVLDNDSKIKLANFYEEDFRLFGYDPEIV